LKIFQLSGYLICSAVGVQLVFDAFMCAGQFVLNQPADVMNMLSDPQLVVWAVAALVYRPDIMKQVQFVSSLLFNPSLI
jgi:hypothetical protein